MLEGIPVANLLLTFSAFLEALWLFPLPFPCFSALTSEFPFSISYWSFATKKKQTYWGCLKRLHLTSIPISFLPFCCTLYWLYKSAFHFSLLPVFLRCTPTYILFLSSLSPFPSPVFNLCTFFSVPLLSIFYFPMSHSFSTAFLLTLLSWYFIFCCSFRCHPWCVW